MFLNITDNVNKISNGLQKQAASICSNQKYFSEQGKQFFFNFLYVVVNFNLHYAIYAIELENCKISEVINFGILKIATWAMYAPHVIMQSNCNCT